MAWTEPPDWYHGSANVTAARMQYYSDNQDYINGKLGTVALVPFTQGNVSNAEFYFQHRRRYLFFKSDGSISYASGSASLTEVDGTFTRVDMESYTGLVYGEFVTVTGCSWVQEDDNP